MESANGKRLRFQDLYTVSAIAELTGVTPNPGPSDPKTKYLIVSLP